MEKKPTFYAILPASVRYDKNLSSSEKLFYAELTAMSEKEGYSWASNSHYAELFDVSTSTVSSWVASLRDKNHIIVKYKKKGKQVIKREIYPIQKIGIGYSENTKGVVRKSEGGYSENPKENITSSNNTSKNNSLSEDQWFEKREEIDIPDSLEEVKEYVTNQGWPDYIADNFFNNYAQAGWCYSMGRNMVPVKNWKAKLHNDVNKGFHRDKPKPVLNEEMWGGSDI